MNLWTLKRVILSFFLLVGLVFLSACELKSIAEIKADPYKYQKDTARIGGIVTKSYSVLNYGVYEIEDRTGRMFVISRRGVPGQGAKVEVKGNTLNAFSLAGVDYGTVLQEDSRKIHN